MDNFIKEMYKEIMAPNPSYFYAVCDWERVCYHRPCDL